MNNLFQVEIVSLISLIATACYLFFYKFIYKRYIKPRNLLIEQAILAMPKIQMIHQEFYINGGGSMTDRMIRIENSLITVGQKQHIYLLEHALGIFESDAKGDCIGVNRTYCRMVDRTVEECLGTGWVENVHPEDVDDVIDAWNKSVKGKRDFRMNYRMVKSTGQEISIFVTAHPMKNPWTKEVIGFMGSVKELSDEEENVNFEK
jgi:PAS domain S-box